MPWANVLTAKYVDQGSSRENGKLFPSSMNKALVEGPLRRAWEFLLLSDCFGPSSSWCFDDVSYCLPDVIVQRILSIPRQDLSVADDFTSWGRSSSGGFCNKSAHNLGAYISKLSSLPIPNLLWIGKASVSSRVEIFLWLCVQDKLHTKNLFCSRHSFLIMLVLNVVLLARILNMSLESAPKLCRDWLDLNKFLFNPFNRPKDLDSFCLSSLVEFRCLGPDVQLHSSKEERLTS
ncbi:hypothetical protein ACH5RR_032458 [Cinchona calisaya]|uniref:Reverse transcriptase zinc-binding domain-containing protein n=1 Tax=Cinchona calisaya TaxID=153742 RepID=A0ABD2YJH7_9GENT